MKTAPLLIVGCMCLLVAGCYADVPTEHFEKAKVLCEKNEGLKFLRIHSTRDYGEETGNAFCNDGAIYPERMVRSSGN